MHTRQTSANPSRLPLANLIDAFATYQKQPGPRGQDHARIARQLAAQLGLLPSLAYLRDGPQRSHAIVDAYGEQLDDCLRKVDGGPLDADAPKLEITAMLAWIDGQAWPPHDPRMLTMARTSRTDKHPLDGYALSVCHHMSNLFYTPEPASHRALPALPRCGFVPKVGRWSFGARRDAAARNKMPDPAKRSSGSGTSA